MSNRNDGKTDQRARFIRTARELGCDEDPEAFERAVRQVVRPQKGAPAATNHRAKRTATKRRIKDPQRSSEG